MEYRGVNGDGLDGLMTLLGMLLSDLRVDALVQRASVINGNQDSHVMNVPRVVGLFSFAETPSSEKDLLSEELSKRMRR